MENIIEGTDSRARNRSADSIAMFVELESLWPTDESGNSMSDSDVNKPGLASAHTDHERRVSTPLRRHRAVRCTKRSISNSRWLSTKTTITTCPPQRAAP